MQLGAPAPPLTSGGVQIVSEQGQAISAVHLGPMTPRRCARALVQWANGSYGPHDQPISSGSACSSQDPSLRGSTLYSNAGAHWRTAGHASTCCACSHSDCGPDCVFVQELLQTIVR